MEKNENVFVIFNNKHKGFILERINSERWSFVKNIVDKETIIFVTPYLNDFELQSIIRENNINEIIWERYFHPLNKNNMKIKVPLISDNIPAMEKEAALKIEELNRQNEEVLYKKQKKKEENYNSEQYMKNLLEHEKLVDRISSDFPDEMQNNEALQLWKKKDFVMPPPRKILKIKNEYSMNWKDFTDFVDKNF